MGFPTPSEGEGHAEEVLVETVPEAEAAEGPNDDYPFEGMEMEGDDERPKDVNPALQAVLDASEQGDLRELRTALRLLDCPLSTRGADGDTALHLACLYGHEDCVEALLDAGADPCDRDEDGALPLHDACASGFPVLVERLLSHVGPAKQDFMIRAADSDGDTPLHCAARGEHPRVVEFLLEKGADPLAQNQLGETPKMLVEDAEEVLSILSRAEDERSASK